MLQNPTLRKNWKQEEDPWIGACVEGERGNKVKIECFSSAPLGWNTEVVILLPVDSGGFVVSTKPDYHSDQDLENNEREMTTKTSPVNQKTNLNVQEIVNKILM
jgi:hypothetical protein